MADKILFVDDDRHILHAMKMTLRGVFPVCLAQGGGAGLDILRTDGPFAVVVSDYRMPGMDGVEFLERVRECAPNTVRVMLTGHGDLDMAIAAVNRGEVFRFLAKPCRTPEMCRVLDDCIAKYRRDLPGTAAATAFPGVLGPPVAELPTTVADTQLTVRERAIAAMIRRGDSTKQIAVFMNLSTRTVESYRDNIRKKLGLANKKINLQQYLSFNSY